MIENILADTTISNLTKVITVQKIIHDNFSDVKIEDLDHIALDRHLFNRVNLAIEELVEGNLELKHRKPHRVTYAGKVIDANSAVSDIDAFKREMVDAVQVIFSILGALDMDEQEFMTIWENKVNLIKHLTADSKYQQTEIRFDQHDSQST